MVISGITPRLHINPAFKVAICSNTSDLYKDGALTPPSLLLELLLLATGYDAQTHAFCSPITVQLCLDNTQRIIPPALWRSDITSHL